MMLNSPSVSCEHHWLKKKLFQPVAYQNKARQEFQADRGGKMAEPGRSHVATTGDSRRTPDRTLLEGHNHLAIHRWVNLRCKN